MKRIGLFTGSFDPITTGHVDVIERASRLFDQLYVGIFFNAAKAGFFPIEKRQVFVEKAVGHLDNVRVVTSTEELAVEVARQCGVTHFVRGLRNGADLTYETNMEFYNQRLASEVETVYLNARQEHREISSTRIRELLHFKAPVQGYVPEAILEEVTGYEHD